MRKFSIPSSGLFMPFRIAQYTRGACGVFGGAAPGRVNALPAPFPMEHLFTMRWEADGIALTCLVTNNFELILRDRRRLKEIPSPAIQVFVHSDLDESISSNCVSRYPASGLLLGLPSSEPDPNETWAHHKVGGVPFAMEPESQSQLHLAIERGYSQIMQLCFPDGADTTLKGAWPFGEDTFYLLSNQDQTDFLYLVGR